MSQKLQSHPFKLSCIEAATFAMGVLFAIALLFSPQLKAQITHQPAFPVDDQPVTIYFDASSGNKGLIDYTGSVYTHTGVLTDKGKAGDLSDWKYVVSDWGVNTPTTKLNREGPNLYSLTIYNIRSYYGVPSGEKILKLAMVFRSETPDKTGAYIEGKGKNDSDLFVDLYTPGTHVSFLKPAEQTTVLAQGDAIEIEALGAAIGSTLNTIQLYKDGVSVSSTTADTLRYSENAGKIGRTEFMAIATAQSGKKDTAYAYFVVPKSVTDQPRPSGIKEGIYYDENDPTKVTLSLLAPFKQRVYVIGEFNDWQVTPNYQMKREVVSNDEVYWWLKVSGLKPGKEYAFQYLVDEEIRIADPYAEKVLHPDDSWIEKSTYPNLKLYPTGKTSEYVSVLQTQKSEYNWNDGSWQRPDKKDLVIYELLLRDFTENHDYATLIDTLDYLQRLGINAIELMPVNEFEGNNSWGYNPVFYFAPDRAYGPEGDLKRLVNEAHSRGMAVILDMVFNHSFGQSPMVRLYNEGRYGKPTPQNIWFNVEAKHPFNVGYDFNHESKFTQRFIDRVNKYWIKEYHVDGYRYDLSKGFTQRYSSDVGSWNQYDQSRINLLERMKDQVYAFDQSAYLILEHLGNNDEETVLANYGFMLWGIMHSEYKNAAMGFVNNGSDDLSRISYKNRGWNDPNLVGYMESHDEERIMVELLNFGNGVGSYSTKNEKTALNRMKLAHAFLLAVPGPKMIWQFGELGYDISIEENGRTGEKPILWEYRNDTDRYRLYRTIAEMNKLKTTVPAFGTSDFDIDLGGKQKRILLKSATDVQLLGNFDVVQADVWPYGHNSTGGKWWYEYFSGDSLFIGANNLGTVSMAPGQFEVYSTKKLGTPPPGLLNAVAPKLSLPTKKVFFETVQGQSTLPAEKKITVSNTGSAPLVINDIVNFSPEFSVHPRSATIQPSKNLELTVSFNPTTTGSFTDRFSIKTNAAGSASFTVSGIYRSSLPEMPTLLLPENDAGQVAKNTSFSWTKASGAERYEILITQYATNQMVVQTDTITQIQFSTSTLDFETKYAWKVRSLNTFGESGWSSERNFTTIIDKPGKPILLLPVENAIIEASANEFSWEPSDRADSYNIQFSLTSDFSNPENGKTDITKTRIQNLPLTPNRSYFWRVQAVNMAGSSDWSTPHSFETLPLPPKTPSLISPAHKAENLDTQIEFRWSDVDGSDSYTFQLSTAGDFSSLIYDSTLSAPGIDQMQVAANTDYYWRVKAENAGGESAWSPIFSFSTKPNVPDKIIPIAPDSGKSSVSTSPLLSWKSAAVAQEYEIEIADHPNFTPQDIIRSKKVTGVSELKVSGLSVHESYYWRVRGSNVSGDGAWSNIWSFTTSSIETPEPVFPTQNQVNISLDATLVWKAASGALTYSVEISESPKFTIKATETGITDTLFAPNFLEKNKTYYWRIKSASAGNESSWSATHAFSTLFDIPSVPQPVSPENNASDVADTFTASWKSVSHAWSYHLQFSMDSLFTNTVIDTAGLTQSSFTINELLARGAEYFWRVRAVNPTESSDWSNVMSLSTLPEIPKAPQLVAPADSSNDLQTTLTFSWREVDSIASYRFQLATDRDFTQKIDTTDVADTTLTISVPDYNERYFWRVQAKNIGGVSKWSAIQTFKTIIQKPEVPEIIEPIAQAAIHPQENIFAWKEVSGASTYRMQISEQPDFISTFLDTVGLTKSTLNNILLNHESTYYWRVNTTNKAGSSAWSNIQEITTTHFTPLSPKPVVPKDSLMDVSTTLTFSWNAADSSTTYRFQLSGDRNFTQKMDTAGIADTMLTISSLTYDKTYHWRVRAENSGGNSSWSEARIFRTIVQKPEQPAVIEPLSEDVIHPAENAFVWSKVKSATSYRVQISAQSDFATTILDSTGVLGQKLENISLETETGYYWRIQAVNRAGVSGWSEVQAFSTLLITSTEQNEIPEDFKLNQNFPNPFNPTTIIQYALPYVSEVRLEVFNITGQRVSVLVNKQQSAGWHSVVFDAGQLSSGLYLYRIRAGSFTQIKKLMLIK